MTRQRQFLKGKNMLGKKDCELELGFKDAVHVPVVVVQSDDYVEPGARVRFIDAKSVRVCSESEDAHAIADPFLKNPVDWKFCVLLVPGMIENVRHDFELNFELNELEKELLEHKKEDPMCAKCWAIEDGKIVRY